MCKVKKRRRQKKEAKRHLRSQTDLKAPRPRLLIVDGEMCEAQAREEPVK
jgi:hypothetical protein